MDSEAKKFIESCIETNNNLSKITKKEIVSDDLAFTSEVIIKNMKVDGVGDALLYASSINVLNTYVKQSDECKKALGYSFKKCVDVLLRYISENPSEMIKAEIQKDKDMSLCILEINTIQFSYHNIELNEYNRKLMAKDPDHPTLKWDGIRKQTCSVTVFNFANDNQYQRTNKMMDGSDYYTGLNQLLDEFHVGKLSLSDSKKTYFGKGNKIKPKKIDDTKVYPLRNNILSLLYKNNIDAFIEQIESRAFFDILFKSYEDGYGTLLKSSSKFAFKYAFETLIDIFKDKRVNADAGIGILYFNAMHVEFPVIVLTSMTSDNIYNVSLIHLLCCEKMCIVNDKFIEYTIDGIMIKDCLHPSYIMRIIKFYIDNALSYQYKTNINSCSYSYNTTFNENSNIVSNFDLNVLKQSPIFYAEERDKLRDYVIDSLSGNDGDKVLNAINDFQKLVENNKTIKINAEVQLFSNIILEEPIVDSKKLYIINAKVATGNTDINNYLTDLLHKNNYNDFEIFTNLPADTSIFKKCKNMLICDYKSLYEDEYQQLKELEIDFVNEGNTFEVFSPAFGVGFNDFGVGVGFISYILRISNTPILSYNKKLYSITIAKNDNDVTIEDGTTLVTIPSDVMYDQVEDSLYMSEDNKIAIYKQLLSGYKGIKLNIKNTPLRNLISNRLNDIEDIILYGFNDDNNNVIDKDDMSTIKNTIHQNSDEYNYYSTKTVKYLGSSAWQKLNSESKSWIVTALSEYYSINSSDKNMDFSGPVLLIAKTFESELCIRLASNYIEYLKNKYPNDYIEKLPEALIDIVDEKKKVKKIEKITLGSMPFIMGVNSKGEINNQIEYDQFIDYGKEELFVDKEHVCNNIKSLCEIIYYIRVNYRNTSAHKTSIDYTVATDCIEYCITEKKKLGIMLDMFNK